MAWPPPLMPQLVAIAGRTTRCDRGRAPVRLRTWNDRLARPGRRPGDRPLRQRRPNDLHAEPTIAAAEAGKHVVCEKPLGRDATSPTNLAEGRADARRALCAFNYRFVPAVRLARQLLESGELGEIHHFRGRYLQEWGATETAAWRSRRGGRARRPRRPRHARGRPGALPRGRDRYRQRRDGGSSSRAARSTMHSRSPCGSRTARSERLRPRASPRYARTLSAGKSTARRGR